MKILGGLLGRAGSPENCIVPLKIAYESIYKMVRDPMCMVADCWDMDSWYMDFKRTLNSREYDLWLNLVESIQDKEPRDGVPDSVLWRLNKNNQYSTKSLYRFLTDRGSSSRIVHHVWKSKLPLKIKFFLWQVFNNRLQVAQNLIRKGWHDEATCCLCGCEESGDHLFFDCHLAKFVWCMLIDLFNVTSWP